MWVRRSIRTNQTIFMSVGPPVHLFVCRDFWVFPRKHMKGIAWYFFACWWIVTAFRTGPFWRPLESGLEGFGRYPVFTAVFTGKYRSWDKQVLDTQSGKNRENTASVLIKQFNTSIKDLTGPWNIEETQGLIIFIYIQMVFSNALFCLRFV